MSSSATSLAQCIQHSPSTQSLHGGPHSRSSGSLHSSSSPRGSWPQCLEQHLDSEATTSALRSILRSEADPVWERAWWAYAAKQPASSAATLATGGGGRR